MQPGHSFSWQVRVSGLTMVASHALYELIPADNGCVSRLHLDISGWPTLFLRPFVRSGAIKAMATENAGLRDCCEAIARQSSHNVPQNKLAQ